MTTNIKIDSDVSKYESRYGKYIQLTADAMKKNYGYNWRPEDSYAFGKYADTFESYKPALEAYVGDKTGKADLAAPLSTGLGLIAMSYAALPIQNFASIQPIDQEVGVIYYRSTTATQDRGSIKKGDVVQSPYGVVNSKFSDYISDVQNVSVDITDKAEYTGAISHPVVPHTVKLNLAGGKIKGIDDGEGHLLGKGIDPDASTVDYSTGQYKVVFTDLEGNGVKAGDKLDLTYVQENIDTEEIPTVKWSLKSKAIRVGYDILQSEYSTISELALRKKLGASLPDQISADLVSQIQSAVLQRSIRKLRDSAIRAENLAGRSVTWSMKPPVGVSDADHRKTFTDTFINAVDIMNNVAGVGEISAIITGMNGKQILTSSGLQVTRTVVSGPHLCGTFNGIPVYYAPNSVLGVNEMLVIYRGENWYEAPMVYAPFLPVTIQTGTSTTNVLTNANAVYHAYALENVVDGFSIRIQINV